MQVAYRRIMLKLSGEALGLDGWLFDYEKIRQVAGVLCDITHRGIEAGVVIGGGNIWRGRQGGAAGMDVVTADQMGMLGTVLNCLIMKDAVIQAGGKACVMSAIHMPQVCDIYRADKAIQRLSEGAVVFFGGGLGNPFFTTDSAVALRACELRAEALLLAKNIDGVYTADPRVHPEAKLIKELSYDEAIERRLGVMDMAALQLCRDQAIPVLRVFVLNEDENILRVLACYEMGSFHNP